MYFKKLELIGFKSFCDKTTLHFEPGITAVVGPNGCGKSNIFDSIRWVLGEQSAKSLRGSEMQDVIFNGTDSKEALGMAEVSLTFDNANRFFNVDHHEVEITRRLFRSGESEYLLNKTVVRLKDILDILLGTGVGAESYSIVAQGKIDLVLSSRPEDRRLVFDEASGITKFKAQKRETLRKLEETEQNLLRVNDIITEVKRQIGSLERQANKARKYREAFEALKAKETLLALWQKSDILRQEEQVIAQLQELGHKESEFLSTIQAQELSIISQKEELKSLESSLMQSKNEILNIENDAIRHKERIQFNSERLKELIARTVYLEGQTVQVQAKLSSDEEKLSTVRKEYEAIQHTISQKTELLSQKESQIALLAEAIKHSLDSISDTKKLILDLVTRIAGVKNEISDFNAKQQMFLARKKRLEIEKVKVFEEKAITEESLGQVSREVDGLKQTVQALTQNIVETQGNLENEKGLLEALAAKAVELDKEKMALWSHKEFLEKLKSKYADINESMNAVIYLDRMPSEKTSGLVIKINELINLDAEDKAYFDPARIKLTGEAKPIELDTENIAGKISALEAEGQRVRDERAAKQLYADELTRTLSGLQQELRAQELLLANKESVRGTVAEQFNNIKEEEDVIVLELSDVERELLVLENNCKESQGRLAQLHEQLHNAEAGILKEEADISHNAKLREEVLVVITQTKTELEALHTRILTDESTLKILEDTFLHDKEALQNIMMQIEENQHRKITLDGEIRDSESKIKEAECSLAEKNSLRKEDENRYAQVSACVGEVLAKIETDKKEMDALKARLYELQMAHKDIEYKYASLKERMLQAYKIDLESQEENAPPQEAQAETLLEEIRTLKEKVDSYGTVNLVAIEEYDELKARYDFLIQQQNDLLSAKEALHQAILKINRTTKQMFLETFEKVRVEFRNYFRVLFNGGDAQVFLTDEQDPLESGIEIICRPPGKKLQNVLLLSGGEKSLSAIALIFAIFKVKPSPFCILDEIDAALDEANVERFGRALLEFAKGSQFIVITHNKRTIINANVMYGITMQESGVSKIVSVKFAHHERQKVQPSEVSVT